VGLRRSAEVTRLGGDGDGIDAIPVSSLLFGLLFAEACVGRVFRVYERGIVSRHPGLMQELEFVIPEIVRTTASPFIVEVVQPWSLEVRRM
jgi:hypothetical protein